MIEITLSGPGKNALGTPLMQKAIADIEAAAGEPLLVRGAGDCFSAGLNLKEVAGLDAAGMTTYLALLDRLIVKLLTHEAPVVACVNGHAIAGGCVIALACDLRIVTSSESTMIGLNEVALGLVFPPRVLVLARTRLAPSHATRVLLEAGLYAPAEALRMGLVHEVAEDPLARARDLLERLAKSPQHAYAATKRELNAAVLDIPQAAIDGFRDRAMPHWTSPELKARLAAVLSKTR